MRKRSCALHSDSEEEFLLLAEYANQKTGYFYDESLHREISGKLENKFKHKLHSKPSFSSDDLAGFDYGTEDIEKMEELQELSAENRTNYISFVLICNDHISMIQKLQQLWPGKGQNDGQSHQQRLIDLYILKINHSNHLHCFKFWLIEPKNAEDPICSSYLKRAHKIVNFEGSQTIGEKYQLQKAKGILFSLVAGSTS